MRYFVRQKIREEKVYLSHMHLGIKGNNEICKNHSLCQPISIGSKALGACLRKNSKICTLVLRNNHIGDRGLSFLVEALAANRTIKSLDLGENSIGPRGAQYLGELLLGEINLSNRSEASSGSSTAAVARRASLEGRRASVQVDPLKKTSIRELYLARNHIGDVGCSSLLQALSSSMFKGFANIVVLDLSGNDIRDGTMSCVCAVEY